MDGGNGNDTIVGDALNFSSFRFGGDPHGSGGADTLIGGNGDDLLIGDAVSYPWAERPRPPAATTACSAARATTGCSATRWVPTVAVAATIACSAMPAMTSCMAAAASTSWTAERVSIASSSMEIAPTSARRTPGREFLVGESRRARTDLLTNVEFLVFLDMTIQVGQIL